MKNSHIRAIVICIIRRDDEIFVFEGRKELEDETYYRPLGGAIEFGEYSEAAVRREFCEEISSEIENLRFCHVLENIFTLEGALGHEVVFVYEGDLADKSIYDQPFIYGKEDNGLLFKALWKSIVEFNDETPLYPDGLLELLNERDANF